VLELFGAQPVLGVVGSSSVYRSLMQDPPVKKLGASFELSLVLLGIGSLNLSKMIRKA
jgi:hypothetical protein